MKLKTVIQIDSREKNNQYITDCFTDKKIDYLVSKLPFGDYMNWDNPRLIIERKNSLTELALSLGRDFYRFKKEIKEATRLGVHIVILIEENGYFNLEDIKCWSNPYKKKNPRAISGETLYKILSSHIQYYNVEVQFTTKNECADKILELLKAVS